MRLLLDIHSFLWFIMGSQELSDRAKTLIEDPANERLFSTASLWEIAIKVSLSKLTLAEPFGTLMPRQLVLNGVHVLNIGLVHLAMVSTLPFHHRDPFDRLVAAQCTVEKLPIVSKDPVFDAYGVQRLW